MPIPPINVKPLKIGLALLLAAPLLQANDLTTLLNALEKRPESQLGTLVVEKNTLGEAAFNDKLMSKVDLYAGYEMNNLP